MENQWIKDIPSADDDCGVCDICGSTDNDTLFFKDGELVGCRSCLLKVDAWDDTVCPICGSEDCQVLYLYEGGGYIGCDECVTEADSNSLIFIEYEER